MRQPKVYKVDVLVGPIKQQKAKKSQSKKRFCSYCGRDRSVKVFNPGMDICKYCEVFDRSAQITAPKPTFTLLQPPPTSTPDDNQ